jgi:hypothetical protein
MSFSIREKIYIRYKRLRVESTRFTVPDSLKRASRFLVCLPKKREALYHVARRLEVLTNLSEGAVFSFSCDSSLVSFFNTDQRNYRILTLDPDSLGFFSNPKGAFLRRLLALQAEVAIDLDFDHNLTNALICLESRAPLRLGGEKKNLGLPFYNLVVTTGRGNDRYDMILDSFLETIRNLIGGKVA